MYLAMYSGSSKVTSLDSVVLNQRNSCHCPDALPPVASFQTECDGLCRGKVERVLRALLVALRRPPTDSELRPHRASQWKR
jgi:hypothetical protein